MQRYVTYTAIVIDRAAFTYRMQSFTRSEAWTNRKMHADIVAPLAVEAQDSSKMMLDEIQKMSANDKVISKNGSDDDIEDSIHNDDMNNSNSEHDTCVGNDSIDDDNKITVSAVTDSTTNSISASTNSVILKDLPAIFQSPNSIAGFSRSFTLDQMNLEITSVDITAHGCYVVVGCGNGFIILYDMFRIHTKGLLIGHIQAKGLHTNLLMTVKITEDCRYCFAGVIKGSSEMLAIDLGRLPVWGNNQSVAQNTKKKSFLDLIATSNYSDAKLRGFGAAVRVKYADGSMKNADGEDVYRLICGKGIKNVHIWQFIPPTSDYVAATATGTASKWICMYDVATNGNTIECVGFRCGGLEVLSKSSGANLRVWDLRQYDVDVTARPTYEDIANSQDVKIVVDEYAFGGCYDFAVISLNAPKAANRDAFEMPERSIEDDNGQRKKRLMRQIDGVVSTNDSRHVLALCTDGGVLYFKNSSFGTSTQSLTECLNIQRNPDVDGVWALKRIGNEGEVLLLRTGMADDQCGSYLKVDLLSEVTASITGNGTTGNSQWNNSIGYYHDSSHIPGSKAAEADMFKEAQAPPTATAAVSKKESVKAAVEVVKSVKRIVKSKVAATPSTAAAAATSSSSNRDKRDSSATLSSSAKKTPVSVTVAAYKTPSPGIASAAGTDCISPEDPISRLVHASSSLKRPRSSDSDNQIKTNETYKYKYVEPVEVPLSKRQVSLNCVAPVVVYPETDHAAVALLEQNRLIHSHELYRRFTDVKTTWQSSLYKKMLVTGSSKKTSNVTVKNMQYCNILDIKDIDVSRCSFGLTAWQQLHCICIEHDRIRTNFVNDIIKTVSNQVFRTIKTILLNSSNEDTNSINDNTIDSSSISTIVNRYQILISELCYREFLDLKGAHALDHVFNAATPAEKTSIFRDIPKIKFSHSHMYAAAHTFCDDVNRMFTCSNS